jgi:hypothetical protein
VLWLLVLLAMLPRYPQASGGLVALSFAYPALYAGLSVFLDLRSRRRGL